MLCRRLKACSHFAMTRKRSVRNARIPERWRLVLQSGSKVKVGRRERYTRHMEEVGPRRVLLQKSPIRHKLGEQEAELRPARSMKHYSALH